MRRLLLVGLAAAAGCLLPKDRPISKEIANSERAVSESHTRSRLAALERSLNDFIRAKRRIPEDLHELVPDYLAEIPEASLGLSAHRDTAQVLYYPPEVIQNGQVDGTRISDGGGWGYVHNGRQVIVFVDCTHQRMDGVLWFRTRGVY